MKYQVQGILVSSIRLRNKLEHTQSHINIWLWQQGTELVMLPLDSPLLPFPTQIFSNGSCFTPCATLMRWGMTPLQITVVAYSWSSCSCAIFRFLAQFNPLLSKLVPSDTFYSAILTFPADCFTLLNKLPTSNLTSGQLEKKICLFPLLPVLQLWINTVVFWAINLGLERPIWLTTHLEMSTGIKCTCRVTSWYIC